MAAPPPLRPYHVALAALLRLHLAPEDGDPQPGSALYRALEDVLLSETRGANAPTTPDLVTLLQRIEARGPPPPPPVLSPLEAPRTAPRRLLPPRGPNCPTPAPPQRRPASRLWARPARHGWRA